MPRSDLAKCCVKALSGATRSRRMLTQAEEQQLGKLAREGDQHSFERLVHAHLPLAFAMASEFRSYGLPAEELLSQALLGLVQAARKFDPARGSRLAGYAALWIRAYLRSYTLANRRIVRGPSTRNARAVLAGLRKAERELGQQSGQRAAPEAIAKALGVSVRDVEEGRSVLSKRDIAYGVAVDGPAFDLASDSPSPEAIVVDEEARRATASLLRRAMSNLDPRARRILQQRHLDETGISLAELGLELGVSRERVRQIESQAKATVHAAVSEALDHGAPPAFPHGWTQRLRRHVTTQLTGAQS